MKLNDTEGQTSNKVIERENVEKTKSSSKRKEGGTWEHERNLRKNADVIRISTLGGVSFRVSKILPAKLEALNRANLFFNISKCFC